ncbi:hypothetical protein DSM106972_065620 [Dulcicalothrix desertica PCC 7102]|uniref:Pvc16 N-terminal domain-containing protein n=1 Tax=Dulcicalothrix desertica PCC 7102 TaxID=232991 RepID=A0A3S1D0N6_9CYAN|nr:Pvc16 family protein [Dulcicalothrix desertica]RUT01465.1 hypothetical protein DSM106972_065620 [Dulcicalothrix desertica PCC 7102]TWH43498.1 carboxypeptidase-like protein [Dulcicalothrix desertica PCC 7102]
MLNSILQTLAEMLASGGILTSTEQINFSPPSSLENSNKELLLNLYLYDVRISKKIPNNGRHVERYFDDSRQVAEICRAPSCFDISIVITAHDRTVLGELHLLSETLLLLMRNRLLQEEFLTPDLRGHGNLSLSVTSDPPVNVESIWSSFSIPVRPAIYLTVTVPFNVWRKTTVPLVTGRHLGVNNSISASKSKSKIQKVAIAGVVKNILTSKPLKRVLIVLEGTEKSATSNEEGYFVFENLTSGNYILQLKRSGYEVKTCNVFVDGKSCVPEEILLMPAR